MSYNTHPDAPKPKYRLAPDGNPYHAYDDAGNPICGAKTRAGDICHARPIAGRKRCRMHGGHSLQGPEHPRFKHGNRAAKNYSLPSLATLTRRFLNDPEYLAVSKEIALVRGLLEQSARRMDALGDLGISVRLAKEGYQRIQDAMVNANSAKAAQQLQQGVAILGQAFVDLNAEQELREDLRRTLMVLKALVGQETVRKKLEGEYLPLPVFAMLLDSLRQAVRALALDPNQTRQFEMIIHDILTQQPLMVVGKAEYIDDPENPDASNGL